MQSKGKRPLMEKDTQSQMTPFDADFWKGFQTFGFLNPPVDKLFALGMQSAAVLAHESVKIFGDLFFDLQNSFVDGAPDHSLQNVAAAYERRVCRMLNIPQLGLTRQYQEHVNRAVDEFNHFCVSVTEFAGVMALPMSRAFTDVSKRLSEPETDPQIQTDPQAFYKRWLNFLEQHYLNLLNSPEFISTLHRVLNRYTDYGNIQQAVIKDFLKALPVCTTDDFDELARDNHALRKELKSLKKTVQSMEASRCNHVVETESAQ